MQPDPRVGFYGLLALYQPAVICDVGSMDGYQAVRFKKVCPQAHVFAFEANAGNYASIVRDPDVVQAEITVENLAASDESGSVTFHLVEVPPDKPWARGVSSLRPRTDEYGWGLTAVETNVEAVRLDDYLAETSGPIALWIDVEGAAAEVIRGLSGIGDRIVLIHVEAESKEIWRDQASWATALGQIQELGPFEVAASASETGADQHNYLLMRRDAPRRRAARAVLLAASPRGATRAFVPAKDPDGWRGVLGRVVGAAVRASARGA